MATLDQITSEIIAHQCNCLGYMGAGVALAIRNRYPKAYEQYKIYGHKTGNGTLQLGMVQLVQINPSLFVANLMAQFSISRQQRMTDYDALATCIEKLPDNRGDVWFPFKMGCGNAGGDWAIVSKIIENKFPNPNYFYKS